jgi:hypothetical protein
MIDRLDAIAAPGFDRLAVVWLRTSDTSALNESADQATPFK